MSQVRPPRWDDQRFERDRQFAIQQFRKVRMLEPLEQYLAAFEQHRAAVETLLEATEDLSRLSELAILVTAREWDQQVEWAIHAPIARQVGIPADVIAAIARGERPQALLVDEGVVVDFCLELHRHKRVSDRTYNDALALFGEQGVVDLMGVNGYYTFLAMVMNTAQTAAPASSADPLPEAPPAR